MTARISLERTFQASLEDVWYLWTTKDGIKSWWGPEGFAVTVRSIDLRPGGKLNYVMTAVAPEQIAFMKQVGAPLATEATLTYTTVERFRRLGYVTMADFIPGVEPYEVATLVELEASGAGVTMRLAFDPMHAEEWTRRAVMGRESEMRKLEALIAQRALRTRS